MRTPRIYSLNNCPIYHTAVLAIVIMLYITSLVLTFFNHVRFNLCIFSHHHQVLKYSFLLNKLHLLSNTLLIYSPHFIKQKHFAAR